MENFVHGCKQCKVLIPHNRIFCVDCFAKYELNNRGNMSISVSEKMVEWLNQGYNVDAIIEGLKAALVYKCVDALKEDDTEKINYYRKLFVTLDTLKECKEIEFKFDNPFYKGVKDNG